MGDGVSVAKIDVMSLPAKLDGDVIISVSTKFVVSVAEVTLSIDDLYIMKKHLEVPTIDITQCDSYTVQYSQQSSYC